MVAQKKIPRSSRSLAPNESGTHRISIPRERTQAFDLRKVERLRARLERGELELDVELIAERLARDLDA